MALEMDVRPTKLISVEEEVLGCVQEQGGIAVVNIYLRPGEQIKPIAGLAYLVLPKPDDEFDSTPVAFFDSTWQRPTVSQVNARTQRKGNQSFQHRIYGSNMVVLAEKIS